MRPTPEQINDAFELVDRVLIPLTVGDGGNPKGEGGDPKVVAARAAMQALYLLRQWARMSVERQQVNMNPAPVSRRPSPPPPPPPACEPGRSRRKGGGA